MNDSLEWTEHLLKRNLNSLSYFEKICWLWKCFFWIIAGAGAENIIFFRLRLRLQQKTTAPGGSGSGFATLQKSKGAILKLEKNSTLLRLVKKATFQVDN